MQYGVCGGPELARIAKDAGYDYFEWSVGGLLHPRENDSVFFDALSQITEAGLPCPALNVFIPGDLKITGPDVDMDALNDYVTTALRRAQKAGVDVIVFGSGGARRIPDGFDPAAAHQQIVDFCRMLAPVAAQHQVTIVVEPLNLTETNVLNTVGESAELVKEVDELALRLLVDGYHWAKDNDSAQAVIDNANLIRHTHVATVDGRRPPRPGDDCSEFFAVLREAGYNGRISIEGRIDNPAEELPVALEIMKRELDQ